MYAGLTTADENQVRMAGRAGFRNMYLKDMERLNNSHTMTSVYLLRETQENQSRIVSVGLSQLPAVMIHKIDLPGSKIREVGVSSPALRGVGNEEID